MLDIINTGAKGRRQLVELKAKRKLPNQKMQVFQLLVHSFF